MCLFHSCDLPAVDRTQDRVAGYEWAPTLTMFCAWHVAIIIARIESDEQMREAAKHGAINVYLEKVL